MAAPLIVHVIQRLSEGGAARVLLTMGRYSTVSGLYRHAVVSLLPTSEAFVTQAQGAGLTVYNAPDAATLRCILDVADLVHVHFWNTPELYAWLRGSLPAMRLMLCPHIGGLYAPQVVTRALVDMADFVLTTSPFTAQLPVLAATLPSKVGMIYEVADLERVQYPPRRARDTFNIGYIGTLTPVKIHPDFVAMSARIDIPTARFIVCGNPRHSPPLQRQADQAGIAHRFDFRGFVEDIGAVLAELDVLGYPLCRDNYSTADLVVQEAMAAGVPPVIFPYGGTPHLVQHGQTGLIVHSADEYAQALRYLYDNPDDRRRLGEAARAYAYRHFGVANTLPALHAVYAQVLSQPKRQPRLTDAPPDASGARLFVASLGDTGAHFMTSLVNHADTDILAAEQVITTASPVVCSEGSGGILHYRNVYPQDAHLRLWSALALMGQGQHVRAMAELRAALDLGLTHWRVQWYLAQVAARLQARPVVLTALRAVRRAAPEFEAADTMLRQWEAA